MENNPEFMAIMDELKKFFCKGCTQNKKPSMFLHVRSEVEIRQILNAELSKSARAALEWVIFERETLGEKTSGNDKDKSQDGSEGIRADHQKKES